MEHGSGFLHPNYNARVACLPTCTDTDHPPRYAPILAGRVHHQSHDGSAARHRHCRDGQNAVAAEHLHGHDRVGFDGNERGGVASAAQRARDVQRILCGYRHAGPPR
jgi:hypothetical protein